MKHFPIQSAALFRSNNTRERETERMREEEEKEAEKEEDAEDACFRGCCRVLKTTKRGTRDDDETNAFPKMTFRLAKDLVNVNAMMTSITGSSFENTTTTTTTTNT